MKNLESVDNHLKELCKNPKFKKEYLKEKSKMTWHYEPCKIIPKEGEAYFAIREIIVKGKKVGWTEDNIAPIGDTRMELIDILTTMLKDACYYNVRTIRERKK